MYLYSLCDKMTNALKVFRNAKIFWKKSTWEIESQAELVTVVLEYCFY